MTKLVISFVENDSSKVENISTFIKNNFQVDVQLNNKTSIDTNNFSQFKKLVREAHKIIVFLSDNYLKSEKHMFFVTEILKDDQLRENFLDKVIPIVDSSKKNPFKIYEFDKQNEYISYWRKELNKLEYLSNKVENKKEIDEINRIFGNLLKRSKDKIDRLLGINESLDQFLQGVCEKIYFNYYKIIASKYQVLYDILREHFEITEGNHLQKKTYSRERLQEIVNSIKPASYSNPKKPEFPFDKPSFPASKMQEKLINEKLVYIKDESTNPTGTHKDRMAWEIMIFYKRKLQSLLNSDGEIFELPQISLISSGSSALAIQNLLNRFKLPKLKVLIKETFESEVYDKLEAIGCEIYKTDLSLKKLSSEDVLKSTDNRNGLDISFRDAIDPAKIEYYDWLSYEILNENPSVVIVPFGSGELFTNILNINRRECLLNKKDNRFKGKIEQLKNCKFYGVTTTDKDSKYFKLCSYFFNCKKFNDEDMRLYKRLNVCHHESKVYNISDDYYFQAKDLCKKLKINVEESSISGFALYLQLEEKLINEKKIIIVNTGKTKNITNKYHKQNNLSILF